MRRVVICILFFCSINLFSQTRIAVLPFSNLDGNFDLNKWCYELQDSLTKALKAADPEETKMIIVSTEEVMDALDDLNIDAHSPSFDSDKWRIVASLNVDRIISGNFRITGNRFLINSYIYYPQTQLSDPDFQAKDIFRREDKVLDAVPIIVRQLSKAFMGE